MVAVAINPQADRKSVKVNVTHFYLELIDLALSFRENIIRPDS